MTPDAHLRSPQGFREMQLRRFVVEEEADASEQMYTWFQENILKKAASKIQRAYKRSSSSQRVKQLKAEREVEEANEDRAERLELTDHVQTYLEESDKSDVQLLQAHGMCGGCWGAKYRGAQTAHPATFSTAPAHQRLGSANAETTPAGAPAAAADRTQRPDATCEGKNGCLSRAPRKGATTRRNVTRGVRNVPAGLLRVTGHCTGLVRHWARRLPRGWRLAAACGATRHKKKSTPPPQPDLYPLGLSTEGPEQSLTWGGLSGASQCTAESGVAFDQDARLTR